jgi:hypothetical protein
MDPPISEPFGGLKRKRVQEVKKKGGVPLKKLAVDLWPSELLSDLALTGGKRKKVEPKPRLSSTDHLPPRGPGPWQTWNYINRYRQKVRVLGRLLFSLRDYREIQCADNTILTLIEIRITEMDEVTVRRPLDFYLK